MQAPVKALLFTPDGKYVLSCAVGERHVAMWQCEGSKADTGVVCSLSLEHPAVALDCTGFDKEGEILRIVAVSEGGVAYIWSAPTVAELGTAKATTISTKGTGKGSKSANSSVLAAR
jgi:U3 small nucleolar RNA-associated protein 5